MEPIEYLRLVRRRWAVIALAGLLAGLAVWVITPPTADLAPRTTYDATHTLYRDPAAIQVSTFSLDTMALLATVGEIPRRVAEELGTDTEPALLAAQVSVQADNALGTLRVTSSAEDGERAALLANAFAEETLEFFDEREEARRVAAITRLTDDIVRREERVRSLDAELNRVAPVTGDGTRRILGAEAELVQAERDAAIRQYGVAVEQLSQTESQQAQGTGLVTLEAAFPVPRVDGGFQAPTNRGARALLAVAVGCLLGLGLALGADRLDTRVRSRRGTEDAFEIPVIAEVPRVRAIGAKHDIITASRPASFAAESYRILRLTLQMAGRSSAAQARHPDGGQVVLVTSAGPGEGKTTTVGNLAVSFAEVGKRVLVLDADFRNPQQHRYFALDREPGLTQYLSAARSGRAQALSDFVHATGFEGVVVVPNGRFSENPGELLGPDQHLVEEARRLADVVIIDAGPILAVNEPQALMPDVDSLVVVARSGRTQAEAARRTTDLLARLDAPVAGVALVDVPRSASAQPYYAQVRSMPLDVRRTWNLRRSSRRQPLGAHDAGRPRDLGGGTARAGSWQR